MNRQRFIKHRLENLAHTALLLLGLAGLLGGVGWLLGGSTGLVWTGLIAVFLVLFSPRLSSGLVLRMHRARRLTPATAPDLFRVVTELARRAGLPAVPGLYLVPSDIMNAFAVGRRGEASIALTEGLLRVLDGRELAAVLAHEVSHIRSNDMWVMGLADIVTRVTSLFAHIGQLMLILFLPFWFLGGGVLSLFPLGLLLVAAPALSSLMQLALSRSREFDADLDAAELTGNPRWLASALARMEVQQRGLLARILLPGQRLPEPSLLRSHPPTEERIRRLLELANPSEQTSSRRQLLTAQV